MTTLTLPPPVSLGHSTTGSFRSVAAPAFPQPFRWTCDEFHQIGDAGLFEGKNVILIDGEILEMPASGGLHDVALMLIDHLLHTIFVIGFVVRCQMSLILGKRVDPIPDFAVVAGSPRDYVKKPATALLVGEVSDSSLLYDTGDKACLYASAGIADYWVVDLVNRQLIVFRDPQPNAAKPYGFEYTNVTTLQPGQSIAPLAAPGSPIAVVVVAV